MSNKLLCLLLGGLFCGYCTAQQPFRFAITVYAQSDETRKIYYSFADQKHQVNHAVLDSGGKFVLNGVIRPGQKVKLWLPSGESVSVYPDSRPLSMIMPGNNFKHCDLYNEQTLTERNLLDQELAPVYEKLGVAYAGIDRMKDSLQGINALPKSTLFEDSLHYFTRDAEQLRNEKSHIQIQFIKTHPHSFLCLDLLRFPMQASFSNAAVDETARLFEKLDWRVKKAPQGVEFANRLANLRRSGVGRPLPDFKVTTTDGQIITAQTYKNHALLLLNFWSSACVPCRQEFPFLKEVNEKYRSKGLQLLGLSTDSDSSLFLRALASTKLPWPNAMLRSGHLSFAIPFVPITMLIDRDGRILGKWYGFDKNDKETIEALLLKAL